MTVTTIKVTQPYALVKRFRAYGLGTGRQTPEIRDSPRRGVQICEGGFTRYSPRALAATARTRGTRNGFVR